MRTLRNVILVGLLLWCCATYREYQGKPTPVKDKAEMLMDEWQAESQQGLVGQETVFFKKEQGLFKNEGGLFKKEGGLFKKEGGLFKNEGGLFKNEGGLFKKKGRHEMLLPF